MIREAAGAALLAYLVARWQRGRPAMRDDFTGVAWPTTNLRATLAFGATYPAPWYSPSKPHKGLDLSPQGGNADEGQPVFAALPGVVTHHATRLGGNVAHLECEAPFDFYAHDLEGVAQHVAKRTPLVLRYAHLQGFDVRHGAKVRNGQRIARLGNTGASTGAHLHLELRLGSAAGPVLDPLHLLVAGLAGVRERIEWSA